MGGIKALFDRLFVNKHTFNNDDYDNNTKNMNAKNTTTRPTSKQHTNASYKNESGQRRHDNLLLIRNARRTNKDSKRRYGTTATKSNILSRLSPNSSSSCHCSKNQDRKLHSTYYASQDDIMTINLHANNVMRTQMQGGAYSWTNYL